jgi:hypothetical protein
MSRKKIAETPERVLDTAALVNRLTPQGADGPSPRTIERWRMTGERPKSTHPVTQRKQAALESFDRLVGMRTSEHDDEHAEHKVSTRGAEEAATPREIAELLKDFGGRREARTRDLRVANARSRKGYLVGASAHRRRRSG